MPIVYEEAHTTLLPTYYDAHTDMCCLHVLPAGQLQEDAGGQAAHRHEWRRRAREAPGDK